MRPFFRSIETKSGIEEPGYRPPDEDPAEKAERGPAAGWYPDPDGGPDKRYWDGTLWTADYNPPRPAARAARTGRRRWLWVVVPILLIVIAAWLSGSLDEKLYPLGLNLHDCIKNGFGAVFCGDDAKDYCNNIQQTTGACSEIQ